MIRDAQIYFGMETPLRGRSGGHTGTAPTIPTRASKLQAVYSRKQGFDDALQAMYSRKQGFDGALQAMYSRKQGFDGAEYECCGEKGYRGVGGRGDAERITCFKTKGHHLDASLHTNLF